MPPLTWRSVVVPDLGSNTQQGIRTASDLLNRALGHATAGVGQLQQMEADQKAARTQAADRMALENILAAQTQEQLQQRLADGSLFGPARDFVSPEMLLKADARGQELLARADAAYNRERSRTQDSAADALARSLPGLVAQGVKDRQGAHTRLQNVLPEGISLDAARQAMQSINSSFIDNSAERARWAEERKERRADEILFKYNNLTNPVDRAKLIEEERKKDPTIARRAVQKIHALGGDSLNLISYAPRLEGPKTPASEAFGEIIKRRQEDLAESLLGASDSTRIVLNSEPYAGEAAHETAERLATRLNNIGDKVKMSTGELTQYIRDWHTRLKGKYTPAEIGETILNSLEYEAPWNIQNFKEGLDMDDGDFRNRLKALDIGRREAKERKRAQEEIRTLQQLHQAYNEAQAELVSAQLVAARTEDSSAVVKAQEKVRKLEADIQKFLEKENKKNSVKNQNNVPVSKVETFLDLTEPDEPQVSNLERALVLDPRLRVIPYGNK